MGVDQLAPETTRSGMYDGDGGSTGRVISIDIHANSVIVSERGVATTWIGLDNDSSVQLAPGLTTEVQSSTEVYVSSGDLVVGDGATTANESATTYEYTAIK